MVQFEPTTFCTTDIQPTTVPPPCQDSLSAPRHLMIGHYERYNVTRFDEILSHRQKFEDFNDLLRFY